MTLAAVFCLSFSSLLYEISLTRWFSIAHWSHLSPLVIGIAMMGTAVSGVVVARVPRLAASRATVPAACLGAGLLTLASFLLAGSIPLDFLRLPVERAQLFYLAAVYLLLSLPFGFTSLASCAAYARSPEKSGSIAFAAMTGSALGAAAPAALFPLLGEGGAVAASAIAALAPGVGFAFAGGNGARRFVVPALCAAGLCGAAALAALGGAAGGAGGPLAVAPSPYKTLSQLLMAPGTLVTSRQSGLWGSVTGVESSRIRFAPGLSLSFSGALPKQSALIVDGEDVTAFYELSSNGDAAFARSTIAYAAYELASDGAPASCLVLLRDGGLGPACAIASGARRITAASASPPIRQAVQEHYNGFGVTAVRGNPRAVLGEPEAWEVIQIEDWGPTLPAMASLAVDALLTVDSLAGCWRALSPSGVFVVGRTNVLPPSDSLRLFASALKALDAEGVKDPASHVAVIRSWDVCALLISRRPLEGRLADALEAFCAERGFDTDWRAGMTEADSNRFVKLPEPWYSRAYAAIASDPRWISGYFLDAAPQSDDRPFPSRFLLWARIGEYMGSTGEDAYRLLSSGDLAAGAGLVVSMAAAAVLLGIMGLGGTRRSPAGRGSFVRILIVAAVGAGYMTAEISFLYVLTVLLSSPALAIVVTLGAMLALSGIGGLLTSRRRQSALGPALAAAAVLLSVLAATLAALHGSLLALSPVSGAALALAAAAASVLLGAPFPLALRREDSPGGRARAWAANGATSVIASAAAPLLAIGLGISSLLAVSAGCYALATAAALIKRK